VGSVVGDALGGTLPLALLVVHRNSLVVQGVLQVLIGCLLEYLGVLQLLDKFQLSLL
jgi:hypothetical protein